MKNLKILFISNFNLSAFFQPILNEILKSENNITVDSTFITLEDCLGNEYNSIMNQMDCVYYWLDYNLLFEKITKSLIMHKISRDEAIQKILIHCENLMLKVRGKTDSNIIWMSFENYSDKLYNLTGSIISEKNIIDIINYKLMNEHNITIIDSKHIIANVGIDNTYSVKKQRRWHIPYSDDYFKAVSKNLVMVLKNIFLPMKKCLVLDCDNVLWGGIVSEVGVNQIDLSDYGSGYIYKTFQKIIYELHEKGLILTIASKNDLKDVEDVFENHPEMVLKKENITTFQVSWNNKYESILKISEMLNIGLESIVFIDDSIFEIKLINKVLPEVKTILFNKDNIFKQLKCVYLKTMVDYKNVEARRKTYTTNILRNDLKERSDSFNEYLTSLQTKVLIEKVELKDIKRIHELSLRANKCTNGKRLSYEQCKNMYENDSLHFYSVEVSDVFSNLGTVGAFIINGKTLELFVLSCRALGRGVEDQMINEISKFDIDNIYFDYNKKNDYLKDKLSQLINC